MAEMTQAELMAGLERADKLICWMSLYIGNMAPGSYGECYSDLNKHSLFMARMRPEPEETT